MKKLPLNILRVASFTLLLSVTIACIALTVFVLGILYLTWTSIPSNPQKINDSICVHFEQNTGSNEHYLIFSYSCDTRPDWDIVMYPPHELLHKDEDCYDGERWDIGGCALPRIWEDQGIIDQVDTMECPLITIEGKVIEIKQNKTCDWFAHDYEEPEYLKFTVNEEGEFIPLT